MTGLRSAAMMAACLLACVEPVSSAPQPLDAFARLPAIRDVAISPNARNVVFVSAAGDMSIAVSYDRMTPGAKPVPILRSESGDYEISWCNWANDKRILCSLRAMAMEIGRVYSYTRLVGVNADGSNVKVLIQDSEAGRSQFHDRIIDWTPNEPDTVLIALDDDANGYPTVFALDVDTGARSRRDRERIPITSFVADAQGNIRLGLGHMNTDTAYYARLENDREWRELARAKAFTQSNGLLPIAVAPGRNIAYAIGDLEGRSALWEMDLTDQREPTLVFSHPLVDADSPLLSPEGRLLGIWYELDRPFVHYVDESSRSLVKAIDQAAPGKFNVITDRSRDDKVYVIRSFSDVDGGSYAIFDGVQNRLLRLGTAYPELKQEQLGRMRSVSYKARDGTEIPGYLTVPAGTRAEKLPLIVMPHGGPISRDSWEFNFVRAFLVDRGYAVLQMNFRGSSGYGTKWFLDAHQDWGGLTYSDITDGARWAVAEGIADPARMCIVGWSFGGYAALLGAVRNSDLYRCSASIAGVSDLNQLLTEARFFTNYRFTREQLGHDGKKLKEDSPQQHVDKIQMPVLLVHGDMDAQVEVDHSRKMESALKKAGKPHRAVYLKDATHQLDRKSDRVTLLTELEKFLREHLGPGVLPES